MAVNSNVPKPQFQDTTRSKVVRQALEEHDAAVNDLQNQIDLSLTPPAGSEVPNARDGFDVLRDRLRSSTEGLSNIVIQGGTVAAQSTPDLTVQVGSVVCMINGVGINLGVDRAWSRSSTTITITEASHTLSNGDVIHAEQSTDINAIPLTDYTVANVATNTFDITGVDTGDSSGTLSFGRDTGAVTAPTNEQWAVPTISSDGTLSSILGSDIINAVCPTMAITNRPLAMFKLISSTISIVNSDIADAKEQGVILSDNLETTKWYWKVQSAVDAVDDFVGGNIKINAGNYYEQIDMLNKENIQLDFNPAAIVYRISDVTYCLKALNGSLKNNVTINGGVFNDNGKAGSIENIRFDFILGLKLNGLDISLNAGSSATNKSIRMQVCNDVIADILTPLVGDVGVPTTTNYHVKGKDFIVTDKATEFKEDVTFTGADLLVGDTDRIKGVRFAGASRELQSTGSSQNTIFDALAPFIPNTNDEMMLNGSVYVDAFAGGLKNFILFKAVRTSGTTIDLEGMQIPNTATPVFTVTCTDGNASIIRTAFNW